MSATRGPVPEVLEVRVAAARMVTPLIRELTLVPAAGTLPAFSSGSHVQLLLDTGARRLRNAYSLLGDPRGDGRYRIAVRKQDASRGGSAWINEHLDVGARVAVTAPRNLFALHSRARRHLLIAGGIGITPFLAHLAALDALQAEHALHYAYREGLTDAYRDELQRRLGERFHGYDGRQSKLDVHALLAGQPLGTHVYVCGPERLIAAVRDAARTLGWPASRVHAEAFSAAAPGRPFTVRLRRSGRELAVAADQSLLEALEQAGVEVPNLCRGGACGQCVTPHLDGTVEHRDHFLTDDARSTHLMPCVSRACGATLTLDL